MTRILYLHGFASSPSSAKACYFRERLEDAGARVDIPDLAAGDFEHLTITGQLAVVDRAAAGDPISLIGSSMGGYLAALYAARHPEVVRAVLLAPAFGFARRWAESLGAARVDEWRRTGVMYVHHYGEDRDRQLGCQLIDDGASYEDYPDFRQPALIFHGARDDVVPVRYSGHFAATHPNARLETLDSGHQLLDVLDEMAPKVVEFLKKNGHG
jgi:pimeloyl-ACP methyl ester carboxylesterase